MPGDVRVLDALGTGHAADAAGLVFEYVAATMALSGGPVPATIDQLPAVLASECRDLAAAYPPPGVMLVAYSRDRPIGCVGLAVGLAPHPDRTGEVKRLYVRPEYRGGVGQLLMSHAHRHAARHGLTRLVLDVLPERTAVIEFYRRLGYTDCEPFTTSAPEPMVYLARSVRCLLNP